MPLNRRCGHKTARFLVIAHHSLTCWAFIFLHIIQSSVATCYMWSCPKLSIFCNVKFRDKKSELFWLTSIVPSYCIVMPLYLNNRTLSDYEQIVSMAEGDTNRLAQAQAQVKEVTDVMRVNVDKVLERDSKLSDLNSRADNLQAGANQFQTRVSLHSDILSWNKSSYFIVSRKIFIPFFGLKIFFPLLIGNNSRLPE